MKTAVLNIKIDPKVKREAQKVADALGFTLSALVNAHLKDLARSKTVTHTLLTLEPSSMLQKILRQSRKDRLAGKSYGPFTTAEDMMKSLNS